MKTTLKHLFRLGSALALALSATLSARANYPSTVLSQSPVAYYRLNESVQPTESVATNSGSLGDEADGQYASIPELELPGPFSNSIAAGFDGASSYVSAPWVAGMNTASFTFETWAKPAVVPNFAYLASSVEANSPRSGWYLAQDNGSTFGEGSAWVVRFFNQNGSTPVFTSTATNLFAAVDGTGWVDLVLTYDGTTGSLYTNGVLAMSAVLPGMVPNVDAPFTVGVRSSLNFEWPGEVAETALYGTALTASQVATHYNAAITAPTSYPSVIEADSPLVYYQYNAPPQPVAANSGTLGSAANGLYLSDAVAGGLAGPTPPSEPGFESTNLAPSFDGGGGAVQYPALNLNTNTITITCWVNASGPQNAASGIVVCDGGTTGAGILIDANYGGLGLGYTADDYDENTYSWSPNADSGLPQLNAGEWDYVALVLRPNDAEMYIGSPTIPFTGATNLYPNSAQAFDAAGLIGTDIPTPTYSFSGGVDEVGFWNHALSAGQLYTQYGAAVGGLPPLRFSDPTNPVPAIVAGDTLKLYADIGGTPNLSFQWYMTTGSLVTNTDGSVISGGTAIVGATNAVYSKDNFTLATDQGKYYVTVTNLYGATNSGYAVVTGVAGFSPVISSQPIGGTIYPGGSVNLSVVASGGGLHYQWNTNGTPILGATQSTYYVASVTTNNSATYTVSVTNPEGTTNSAPAVISVPVLATGTYAQVVDADAPEAWWRLNDASATNGAVLADVMGRHYGVYTNLGGLSLGHSGAIHGGIAGSAAYFDGDGSFASVPYFSALSGQKFSLELWVEQPTVENNVVAVSSTDSSGDGYGVLAGDYWEGLTGGAGFGQGPGVTTGYDPTIYAGDWDHIVIIHNPEVISGTSYPWTIWVNGVTDGYIWGDGGVPFNTSSPFIIGGLGTGNSSFVSDYFIGKIQEVAFYSKVLTSSEIQAHYDAAYFDVPPTFTVQPVSVNATAGSTVSFSVTAVGTQPIAYQWKKNGVNIAGQTNATLTVSNVFYTDSSAVFSAAATNAFGGTNSSTASVTVYYPPTYANLTNGLVLHLPFDGNYNDTSGEGNNGTPEGSPTFVPGFLGGQALQVYTDTTNGTYNYVSLGDPNDLMFSSNVDFSVSYWVQIPTNSVDPDPAITNRTPGDLPFLCSAVTSTGGWGLTIAPAYKTGGWAWSLDNSSKEGAGVQGPADTINDGGWHNVVETFARSGNCVTYLDGAQVNTTPIAGIGDVDSGVGFNIGQDPTGTYGESGGFNLDDMGVWRRALSYSEAVSVYAAGKRGQSFNVFGPATLSIYQLPGGNIGVAWQAGTLKQAGSLRGPWTTVPGATAPFYQTAPTSTNVFYSIGQ